MSTKRALDRIDMRERIRRRGDTLACNGHRLPGDARRLSPLAAWAVPPRSLSRSACGFGRAPRSRRGLDERSRSRCPDGRSSAGSHRGMEARFHCRRRPDSRSRVAWRCRPPAGAASACRCRAARFRGPLRSPTPGSVTSGSAGRSRSPPACAFRSPGCHAVELVRRLPQTRPRRVCSSCPPHGSFTTPFHRTVHPDRHSDPCTRFDSAGSPLLCTLSARPRVDHAPTLVRQVSPAHSDLIVVASYGPGCTAMPSPSRIDGSAQNFAKPVRPPHGPPAQACAIAAPATSTSADARSQRRGVHHGTRLRAKPR